MEKRRDSRTREWRREPKTPRLMPEIAREFLRVLSVLPNAKHLALTGGLALLHYFEHRTTLDVDLRIRADAKDALPEIVEDARAAANAVAERRGMTLQERMNAWRSVVSFDFEQDGKKEFSVQVDLTHVAQEEPQRSEWLPIGVETLRENMRWKMSALVARGAPRDFVDVRRACGAGIFAIAECWALWSDANPGKSVEEAKPQAALALRMIEKRRPLDMISDSEERERAGELRRWFHAEFFAAASCDAD